MNTKRVKTAERAFTVIYLASVVLYLLYEMQRTTTFFLPVPAITQKVILIVMTSSAVAKALLNKKTDKLLWAALGTGALYLLIYYKTGYPFLLFSGVMTAGCCGLSYRKLLKIYCGTAVVFLSLTFLCTLGGSIENYVYMKDGMIRSSWGICYPTDMASYVLYLVIFSWVAWKGMKNCVALLLGFFSLWISKYIAMSITSTLCSILFICMVVLLMAEEKYRETFRKLPDKFRAGFLWTAVLSFPLLAVLMFSLMYLYSKGVGLAVIINGLLTDRLMISVDAFRNYGLHILGTPFEQIGNGFSTFKNPDYNFVDSSYALILIRYGWPLLTVLCATWSASVRRAVCRKDWRLMMVMVLIAVHSFSEHHFIEPFVNILVVMPFASYECEGDHEMIYEREAEAGRRKYLPQIVLICAAAAGLVMLPGFLSWMRTLTALLGWKGGGRNSLKALAAVFLFLSDILLLLLTVSGLFCRRDSSGRIKKLYFLPAGIFACLLGSAVWLGNTLVQVGARKYEKVLKSEEAVVRDIISYAKGKVYSNILPEVYKRRFGGFSYSILSGEELARLYNCSVIMDINQDARCLTDSGFLFCPISGRHSLYTNDEALARGLSEKGYHLTGYYNVEKSISLKSWARQNGLVYEKGEGIRLSGKEHSLLYGPGLSLYRGQYTVAYDLKIDVAENTENDFIGLLRVSAYDGKQVLKEYKLYHDLFDDTGRRTFEIPFSAENYFGMGFQVLLEPGQSINVEAVRFWRSPEYDIHSIYDKQRRKIREEYYDLEGQPTVRTEGCAACEFEYNYDRYITEIRYYDEKNMPVLINGGYAKVRRKLDNRNRVIREEYYGTDGNPVMRSGGYAANERDYDDAGNAAVQRFYGLDGRPVITSSNYSEVHRVFDENGRVIKESYFDTDGQPLSMPQGYSVYEKGYDVNGNVILERFCDDQENLVMTVRGFAVVKRQFNEKAQIIREEYYDITERPVNLTQKFAALEREYNSSGQVSSERYFDVDGKPVITAWGYAEVHREYDGRGRISKETYYDTERQPMTMPQGYALNEREYNDLGQAVVQRYCDADGNPVITTWGYAEVHREFDSRYRIIKEAYYDEKHQPLMLPQGYGINEREYNSLGQTVVQRFFDLEGKLVITTWGYAVVHREFNEKTQITGESYFGTDEEPLTLPQGYAKTEINRDDAGRVVSQRYYGIDGKPAAAFWGYYEVRRSYNESGELVSETYYDDRGNSVTKTT